MQSKNKSAMSTHNCLTPLSVLRAIPDSCFWVDIHLFWDVNEFIRYGNLSELLKNVGPSTMSKADLKSTNNAKTFILLALTTEVKEENEVNGWTIFFYNQKFSEHIFEDSNRLVRYDKIILPGHSYVNVIEWLHSKRPRKNHFGKVTNSKSASCGSWSFGTNSRSFWCVPDRCIKKVNYKRGLMIEKSPRK